VFPLSSVNECSGLFPLISNLGSDILTGAHSVSLPLLKLDMLGCVGMDGVPLFWTTLG
jgi:hypothetical protein